MKHGTEWCYRKHKCRCADCLLAHEDTKFKAREKHAAKRPVGRDFAYAESPEERKRSNDAWRRRFEIDWGLA